MEVVSSRSPFTELATQPTSQSLFTELATQPTSQPANSLSWPLSQPANPYSLRWPLSQSANPHSLRWPLGQPANPHSLRWSQFMQFHGLSSYTEYTPLSTPTNSSRAMYSSNQHKGDGEVPPFISYWHQQAKAILAKFPKLIATYWRNESGSSEEERAE